MAFNQPTYSERAVQDFNYTSGINPADVVGGRFNDVAAYLNLRKEAALITSGTLTIGTSGVSFNLGTVPANSIITEIILAFKEDLVAGTTSGLYSILFGNTLNGGEFTGTSALVVAGQEGATIAAGTAPPGKPPAFPTSFGNSNIANPSGDFLEFSDNAPNFSATAQPVFFKSLPIGADLEATCNFATIVKYITL